LQGVNGKLIEAVHHAISVTTVDFGVIEGVRSVARQKKLVNSGASQTMNSKHITGEAVDLMAYMDGRGSWEISLYDEVATAMKFGAREVDLSIRWGAAWHVPNIAKADWSMEEIMNQYIDIQRAAGKRPFIDAPHFEIY
tara:strand:+ start:639 stop:1055 length:417 start_codon:yes stop_codon:yes gene_type:complete